MNILVDASLPGLDEAFPAPFKLTRYHLESEIPALLENQDVLLCRSTLKVDNNLIKNHPLRFVATASSGTDHINRQELAASNITVIDAKGSNASSVADYVLTCIAYLNQTGINTGSKAGIIGMGKVGTQVHTRLQQLGYQIQCFDPPKAFQEEQFKSCTLNDLYECDLICIHAELHHTAPYPSFNLIDQHFLEQLKPGCIIINAARGGIVNEGALLQAKQPIVYCTDVYLNEPTINPLIVGLATLCTPHIAGHSLEAKYEAVSMISEQLHRIAGLATPVFAQPPLSKIQVIDKGKSWQEKVLSLYNPIAETLALKSATNLNSEFISLRKKHQHRHDFKLFYPELAF